MSSLYIRVMTGFYTHRKTAKLRSILGDDALWILPRLWAYAAEHQPDGDLSSYESAELANLLGCYKHATSMLQALKDSGYVDQDGKIHDWQEHNGYHTTFAERAKKAAEARWGKKAPPAPPKEERDMDKDIEDCSKHCLEHATSIYEAYPRREAKKTALVAIQKAMKKEPWEKLLELTSEYARLVSSEERRFIPLPATWFNQERYHDNEAVKLRITQNARYQKSGPDRNAGTATDPNERPLSNDLGLLTPRT